MSGPGGCHDCGHDHESDQEDFERRADMMFEAIDGCADPGMEMALIALVASSFLGGFDATFRKRVRRDLIRDIDTETQAFVISQCDA